VAQAIGQVLSNAIGVAISPIPVIALILMLFSRAAARNSLAFLLGWLLGLTGIAVVVLVIGVESSDGGESDLAAIARVLIGALFIALAVKQWAGRPREGDEPAMPAWMASIDDFSAVKAFGLGLLVTVPNPKNLGLTLAAAVSIGAAELSGAEQAITVAVYVLIASVTVIVPVVVYLVAGERATPVLNSMKLWLTNNNATVMTVLFVVLGAKVLGDGIAALG
jgi:hypothetical protein